MVFGDSPVTVCFSSFTKSATVCQVLPADWLTKIDKDYRDYITTWIIHHIYMHINSIRVYLWTYNIKTSRFIQLNLNKTSVQECFVLHLSWSCCRALERGGFNSKVNVIDVYLHSFDCHYMCLFNDPALLWCYSCSLWLDSAWRD